MSETYQLIKMLVEDIHDKQLWYERARQDRSESRMDASQHQMLGLKVALGRALALCEDAVENETSSEAIFRANDHLAKIHR